MNAKLQELQNQFIQDQKNYIAVFYAPNSAIKITMNGKFEIIEFEINKDLSINQIETMLPPLLNEAILKNSEYIQQLVKKIQEKISIQNK